MAGLCQPRAASTLVKALKEEVGLPIHFHTHDTSGIAAASVLAAVEAGADAVDGAIDALSGQTSQPNLGSIIEALRHGPHDSGIDPEQLRVISTYWEQVRQLYAAFESDVRAGASEVYVHGMPGGQYTNLRQQAKNLGLENRWSEVCQAYAAANQLVGDIVKVTPSSKVVGDLALFLVTNQLTAADVMKSTIPLIAFAASCLALNQDGRAPARARSLAERQQCVDDGIAANQRRRWRAVPAEACQPRWRTKARRQGFVDERLRFRRRSQPQFLAQTQQTALGANLRRDVIPFRASDGAEHNGIALTAEL